MNATVIGLLLALAASGSNLVRCFQPTPLVPTSGSTSSRLSQTAPAPPQPISTTSAPFDFSLHAKKKKKSSSKSKSYSNKKATTFGGAVLETCPCGSEEVYGKCCGKIHTDVNAYKSATAEQIVRARYSAYAKRQVDFIIASTHPLNKNFETDMAHWKETIKTNMYDNFELTKCTIVDEEYNDADDKATVRFIAELVQRDSQERTGFMEVSSFERAKTHGGWLYLDGKIEPVPGSVPVNATVEVEVEDADGDAKEEVITQAEGDAVKAEK